MRELFGLPDVGEGLTEAEIAEWKVAPGDTVTVNQIIVEIETAKAAVELPSPYAGTVGELLAEAGRMVQVGEPIIAIETVGDPAPSTAAAGSAAGAPASSASSASSSENGAKIGEAGRDGRIATLVGYGPRQGTVSRRPRRGTGPATGNPSPAQEPSPAGPAIGTPPAAPEPSPAPAGSSTTPTRPDESSSRPAGSYESSSHSGDAGGVGELERPALSGESSSRPAGSYESSSRSGGGGADRGVAGPTAGTVPLAPPPVRKLARDLGVDLYAVTGSGPHGRITRADVETAAAGPTSVAEAVTGADTVHGSGPAAGVPAAGPATRVAHPPVGAAGTVAAAGAAGAAVAGDPAVADTAVANGAGRPAARPSGLVDRREPIRGVRRATAEAMVSSAFTAPHVTEFLDVDVTETMQLRERLRASRAFAGVKLTPLAFVAKALCLAASRTPEVNARWDADAGEIVYFGRVQLGIAAATPRGLMVPKIRDADRLGLRDMAVALEALTTTAREGRTPPADLVGGTITITNVGVFGVDTGTPILNPGEAAILAVGSIKPAPWVVDGELAVRTVCRLALSFDHRLVDGEQGSRFLADVGTLLTDPGVAFTW